MTDANGLLDLADQCVKCGLCLPHCPTFRLTGDESESPRGRIALIQAQLSGQLPPSRQLDAHLDHCLLCRACESACPSLVPYGTLMDGVRALRVSRHAKLRTQLTRWSLDLLSQPRFLPIFWLGAGIARLLGKPMLQRLQRGKGATAVLAGLLLQLRRPHSLPEDRMSDSGSGEPLKAFQGIHGGIMSTHPGAASVRTGDSATDNHSVEQHPQPQQPQISLFLGCVARSLTPTTAESATEVLQRLGYQVLIPAQQTCCGALHRHQGHSERANALLTRNIAVFGHTKPVIGFASACVAELRAPPTSQSSQASGATADLHPADGLALAGQQRDNEPPGLDARELCRFLAETDWPETSKPRPLQATVAIHRPCSQRNQLRDPDAARALLSRIPELQLTDLQDDNLCCGAAGAHLIQHSETAVALADAKIAGLRERRPDYLVTTNTGCATHLQARLAAAGLEIEVLHPVDLLARQL